MNNINIVNSGKYFVAVELERRGFSVAAPMSNIKDFDILALDQKTLRNLQFKLKLLQKRIDIK